MSGLYGSPQQWVRVPVVPHPCQPFCCQGFDFSLSAERVVGIHCSTLHSQVPYEVRHLSCAYLPSGIFFGEVYVQNYCDNIQP